MHIKIELRITITTSFVAVSDIPAADAFVSVDILIAGRVIELKTQTKKKGRTKYQPTL